MIGFTRLTIPLLVVAVLLAVPTGVPADDLPPSARIKSPPTAIVPFDPDKPLDDQNPGQVYLDYATFERLWDAAKKTRRERGEEEVDEVAPRGIAAAESGIEVPDTMLSSALYEAVAGEDTLSITARLQLFARGKGVRQFPLSFGAAAIDRISLDDGPAAYKDGKIMLPRGGHHSVEVHFDLPLKKGWRIAKWQIPSAGAALLSLSLSDADGEPTVNGGVPLVESDAGGEGEGKRRNFTASLGQATEINLALSSRTRAHALSEPSLADIAARLFVTPALDRLEADYDFTFVGGEQDTFSIHFDAQITPVGVTVPDLKSWTLKDAVGGMKVLEFTLASPARDRLQVGFTGEREASEIPGKAQFPKLGAGAARITRKLALLTVPEVKLVPNPPPSFRQVPLDTDTAGTGFGFVGAYSSPTQNAVLAYDLAVGTLERTAEAEVVFQVGRGKVETFAGFQLRSPDSDLHTAAFNLPAGTTVESVLGNRIADWWLDSDVLILRFSGETPEITTALIYLSRQLEEEAAGESGQVSLSAPFPRDFEKVSGTGLLVSHAASDTLLRFDKPVTLIREIAPEQAARVFDFAVVPPFERKRGFEFKEGDFNATVTLSRLQPRFDVIWTMRADVHETWTVVSAIADVEVKRSAIDNVSFTLPASVPEARISGPQVREVSSTVDGELRNYTVAFQSDITDQVRFVIESEVTHSGETTIPHLQFLDANRVERFVIVDNYSKDRIAVEASNATVSTEEELPYQPDYLVGAKFFRLRPDWEISAKLERLETTGGNSALALFAEHTTAIRENGEIWTHARYRLQNRSLQFLPVRIPGDFNLVSASVAGAQVRVDRSADEGEDEFLVPLIQTKPGQIAYDVDLVMRRSSGSEKILKEIVRDMEDPELIGVPVERTTWRVYLPEGYELQDSEGNMKKVTQDEVGLVRAESQLKELKKKVSNSSRKSSYREQYANQSSAREDLKKLDDYVRANKGKAEVTELEQQVDAQRRLLEETERQNREVLQSAGQVQMDLAPSATKPAPNSWNLNPQAIGGRQKEIDQRRAEYFEGIEGKVGLNDNIILGNRDILTEKPDEAGAGKDDPNDEPEEPRKGRGAQLDRLDDNEEAAGEKGKSSELQREQFKSLEGFQGQTSDQLKKGLRPGDQPIDPDAIDGMLQEAVPRSRQPQGKPQQYGAEQQEQTLNQGFTNNARFLNNLAEQLNKPRDGGGAEGGEQSSQGRNSFDSGIVDPFGPPAEPSVNSPGGGGFASPEPMVPTLPRTVETDPSAGGAAPTPDAEPNPGNLGDSSPEGEATSVDQPDKLGEEGSFTQEKGRGQGGFKAEGRVSLPVQFPTDGDPIVFSKLKAHAKLAIRAQATPEPSGRLPALVALVVSLVILFGIDWFWGSRCKRKRRT